MIGGSLSHDKVGNELLYSEPRPLSEAEMQGLWALFASIGEHWQLGDHKVADMRSRWLEFVTVKSTKEPSYIGEYESALQVLDELASEHKSDSIRLLFFDNGIEEKHASTRLGHAKRFVVDEFIRVYLTSGGFKSFGAENYRGHVGGSRFAAKQPYRSYEPQTLDN